MEKQLTNKQIYRIAKVLKIFIGHEVVKQLDERKAINEDLNDHTAYDINGIVKIAYGSYKKKFSVKAALKYTENLLNHMIAEYNNPTVAPQTVSWQKIADRFGDNWIQFDYKEATACGLKHNWNC